MKNNNSKCRNRRKTCIGIALLALVTIAYLLISLYFNTHFYFNTIINGVDVSLKAHAEADKIIRSFIKNYALQLGERNEKIETITGQNIEMQYNNKNDIYKIHLIQTPIKWIGSLIKKNSYYVPNLYVYSNEALENKISELDCLNKDIIEPQNVSFRYSNGSYEIIEEIYGNKINIDRFNKAIRICVLKGIMKLDLDKCLCYENPKYIISSVKTLKTKNLLDKYVSSKITYIFGSKKEVLEEGTIQNWLSVDEDLEVVISEKAVREYVKFLSKNYDTVGIARKIKTISNKIIEVKGGFYGWKINRDAETKELMENIRLGKIIEREPIYAQKAVSRDKNDIGDTYVEINITKQRLWFYKNGRVIAGGAIVTGNPNRGNATPVGVYMLNYKEIGSTLSGADYEAKVNYWMPFNGNIGMHDASWRYSFGGTIYKRNGTHGCVNIPIYLAKAIYENIEAGTPIICYEE